MILRNAILKPLRSGRLKVRSDSDIRSWLEFSLDRDVVGIAGSLPNSQLELKAHVYFQIYIMISHIFVEKISRNALDY